MIQVYNRDFKDIPFSPAKGNQTKYHILDIWIKEDYLGYEAASEYFVSELLKHSNLSDFVTYDIENGTCNDKPILCCVSKDFLKQNEQIMTLYDLWELYHEKSFYKYMENLSTEERIVETVNFIENDLHIPNAGEYLTTLLELDAFTLNEDRHANNIAFILKDDDSFTFTPIFDNGAAFLSDTTNYSIDKPVRSFIPKIKAKPFNTDFNKQLKIAKKLYKSKLQLKDIDYSYAFEHIEKYYGKLVANRIKITFQIQKQRYPNLYFEERKEQAKDIANHTTHETELEENKETADLMM